MGRIRVLLVVTLLAGLLPAAVPVAARETVFREGGEEPLLVQLPEGADVGLSPAVDFYAWDPLGLVAGDDVRKYTSGTDTWEVWVCDEGGSEPVTVSGAVTFLNGNVTPYYEFLSEGRYRPVFQGGGVVSGGYDYECLDAARAASDGGVEAALVISNRSSGYGFGGPGNSCPIAYCGTQGPNLYPENQREIYMGAEGVVDTGVYGGILESLPTHEVGHTIHWSHSFTGNETFGGSIWEYDNPIDVMSGNTDGIGSPYSEPDSYSTVGFNRYAAGWIDPEDVYIHRGGTVDLFLGAVGSSETEMVVIPLGQQGHFAVLDARINSSQDVIPSDWQGVSIHEIDQRSDGVCYSASFANACIGADRRVKQWTEKPFSIDHVLTAGETLTVGGVDIVVTSDSVNGYQITVSGTPDSGPRFTDTSGDVFVEDIEWLAEAGITLGCNPPSNSLFCPEDPVTRGQMAAFLVRALGLTDSGGQGFTDTAGHVFAEDIAKLATAGITKGCASDRFCPDDPVTRGQMAAFLVRAFSLTDEGGASFADTAGDIFEADIAKLATAGITLGCNPPSNSLFCPHDSVTRGQMAAFLHRSETYLP